MKYDSHSVMLGNLFRDEKTGTPIAVDGIEGDVVTFRVLDRALFPLPDGWRAQPIQLTPALLNGLGIVSRMGDSRSFAGHGLLLIPSAERPNNFIAICHGSGTQRCYLQYLHELQVLHRALYRQELPVDPAAIATVLFFEPQTTEA